ncbi:DUF4198 domain-containing protein [Hymenobacter sp. 15J16-1T3B]|uniref:DUF4198 domain-containing protein n=1 Tax=Hymenobacter sp. 15J16-1T3B TaxID=2886941 RepID=UPI001D12C579|nr:DUF4198 domain-containing protein [Hymenobacter sp. 15J16-1T3B]MCC3160454.1 DUF4198 domain-containing protein [Hymenobacter sp. 15J16-1T3B]
MQRLLLPCLLLAATAALAHEFWLQPTRFAVAAGSRVHLGRWVGADFQGTRWTGLSARLEQLTHFEPGTAAPADLTAAARAADTLSTTVALRQPGVHLLALQTNDAFITLPATEFEAYLKEEGLSDASWLRQKRKQQEQPGREAYRRCAKTLLLAGPAAALTADTTYRRRAGHPLEIIPEQNPYALAPGASLTVRVLADGRPAAAQAVQVWLRPLGGQPPKHFTLHTNQNGRALFQLQYPAEVLLATVRMVALPKHPQADWQSTWASLTFGAPGR